MKGFVLVAMLAATLTGCMTQNVHSYAKVDPLQKTITVPAGSSGLLGSLKGELANSGWKMSVYRGPTVSEGTVGSQTKVEHFDTFNTRYSLKVDAQFSDLCVKDFGHISNYDISMIDNQTGVEVFTLDGKGCDSDTVKQFRSML